MGLGHRIGKGQGCHNVIYKRRHFNNFLPWPASREGAQTFFEKSEIWVKITRKHGAIPSSVYRLCGY